MRIIIYTRISSVKQKNNKSFSLQLDKCRKYIKMKYNTKNNAIKIYKEICSAYSKKPNILNNIIKEKNNIIIMSNINRFSRSVNNGKEMLYQCIKNNNILVFVDNDIIFKNIDNIDIILNFIKIAEDESDNISRCVKNIKKYHIQNNKYTGGGIKYGYELFNNKLIENDSEIRIINFISLIKKINIPDILNNKSTKDIIHHFIKNNSKIINSETIENIINSVINTNRLNTKMPLNNKIKLSDKFICDLLNKCNIKYRKSRWTTIKIKQIMKNINMQNTNNIPPYKPFNTLNKDFNILNKKNDVLYLFRIFNIINI